MAEERTIDGRGLMPPEPMELTLTALDTLPDGEELLLLLYVEPHPLYDRALRVHAVLVNRADFAQPHPDIEIALTNRDGAVVTRRSFTAAEYLGVERARGGGMPPGLTVEVQLDVTQPEARTVGYEIRLLAAR